MTDVVPDAPTSSILKDVKKLLGIAPEYSAFDIDIIIQINSAFSTLNQIGVGPETPFSIDDDTEAWEDLDLPIGQLNWAKTYIFLKVRKGFDPPATSFHIQALDQQIAEQEWRLNMAREGLIPLPDPPVVVLEEDLWL